MKKNKVITRALIIFCLVFSISFLTGCYTGINPYGTDTSGIVDGGGGGSDGDDTDSGGDTSGGDTGGDNTSGDDGGDGGGAVNITAPTKAVIIGDIGAVNPDGISDGANVQDVELPPFTDDQGTEIDCNPLTVDGLPAWLSFNEQTRRLSVTGNPTPAELLSIIELIYSCAGESQVEFPYNDFDEDGMSDRFEYINSEIPFLVNDGYYRLNYNNYNLYRGSGLVNTGLVVPTVGLDHADPADAALDYDNDGSINLEEFLNGTNIFIAPSVIVNFAHNSLSLTDLQIGGDPNAQSPFAIFYLDYDGDGDLDLLTRNSAFGNISLVQSNGDGTYTNQGLLAIQGTPESVSIGDFNGDGLDDYVYSDTANVVIWVGLSNGNGTFNTNQVAAINLPDDLIVNDFDEDGNLDVITTDMAGMDFVLTCYSGNGDGTLDNNPTSVVIGSQMQIFLEGRSFGDYDQDGNLDVAILTSDMQGQNQDSVIILLGDGTGSFNVDSETGLGFFVSPRDIVSADIDADDDLDILVSAAPGFNGTLMVLENDGTGSFALVDSIDSGEDNLHGLIAADFDGDSDADVIGLSWNGQNSIVFENDSAGTFAVAGTLNNDDSPGTGVTAYDANADGTIDFANTLQNGVPFFPEYEFEYWLNQ